MKDKSLVFSLIICGYNEEENLDLAITSCLEQNYPKEKYEIIYVDNNSTDNSLKIAKSYPIKILIEKKQGLSEARNKGIKNASGEILVFLDSDLKLDKNYLKFHEKTFTDPLVGAGGGKIFPLVSTQISNYLGVSLFERYPRYLKNRFVKTYPGCNLTIRKKVIEEVGEFISGLKTPKGIARYSEDKEICERIRAAGYKILYNSKAIVYHENSYTFKKLFQVWTKGGKARSNMIRLGKKDPFSILFKFNIPLIYLFCIIFSILINPLISLSLIMSGALMIFVLSVISYINTKMFLESFFIKPLMDISALIIINVSVIYYQIKNEKIIS